MAGPNLTDALQAAGLVRIRAVGGPGTASRRGHAGTRRLVTGVTGRAVPLAVAAVVTRIMGQPVIDNATNVKRQVITARFMVVSFERQPRLLQCVP